MAFTRIQELDGFDTGSGGSSTGNPKYWHQDIAMLIQEENPDHIVEKNIIFKGEELTGLVSNTTTSASSTAIVLLKCPPYAVPLQERYKNE